MLLDLIETGGWLIPPILACSVVAMAIVLERLFALARARVMPKGVSAQVMDWARHEELDPEHLERLSRGSPLGRIMVAGLRRREQGRDIIKEGIEDVGRHVVHSLERYLNTLGTIAAITPLLGLLGTVIGMIKVFKAITVSGVGDPGVLAGGISEALISTAAGLLVAIPALFFHRYLRGKVDALVVTMETETLELIEVLAEQTEAGPKASGTDQAPAMPSSESGTLLAAESNAKDGASQSA